MKIKMTTLEIKKIWLKNRDGWKVDDFGLILIN